MHPCCVMGRGVSQWAGFKHIREMTGNKRDKQVTNTAKRYLIIAWPSGKKMMVYL